MNYEIVELEEKIVVGIGARTSNDDPMMPKIIGGLWGQFISDKWANIKNLANKYTIGLYSDYGKNDYDVTIGAEVTKNENDDLVEKIIPQGKYAKFYVKGDVVKDVVVAWEEIWGMNLDRSYKADFEEYISNVNGVAEINIYVSLN